jgi:hypothetical protein
VAFQHTCRRFSALVAHHGESVAELLQRLYTDLGKAMAENIAIDEVAPEIQRMHPL